MIIGISGKKTSGKDTTGKIINILANSPHLNNEGVLTFLKKELVSKHNWQIKKFADKLKDIICLLIGCTREQLEDEEFKNTPLSEEWIKYQYYSADQPKVEIKMTPRLMMQLIGTECGRDIIHPNIWVNSTISEYRSSIIDIIKQIKQETGLMLADAKKAYLEGKRPKKTIEPVYPNWVITDMRFPNELEAVNKRGFSIRIERFMEKPVDEHISETALDNAKFDYHISNNGTIEELIDSVRSILIKEKIINE